MSLPILYSFRRCPYAIRARIALQYAGQKTELREVELRNKPAEMLAISPKGTVPVLQLHDKILQESLDIMHWALDVADPDNWSRKVSQSQQKEISLLIDNNDNVFKPLLDQYKYSDRHPEISPHQHQLVASEFPKQLDVRLHEQSFLLDNNISLADIALFPFVRQFAFVNKDWFDQMPWPGLQHWLQGLLVNPMFTDIMQKQEPWKSVNDV